MAGRLARIIDRARVVEDRARNSSDAEHHDHAMLELGYLRTVGAANACIGLLTLCGFLIGVTIVFAVSGRNHGFPGGTAGRWPAFCRA